MPASFNDGTSEPTEPWRRGRRNVDPDAIDPRPYVERYRGTAWGGATAGEPAPAAPARRVVLTWPLLIGSVLVVVAIAVTALFMMLGNKPPSGLSAFRDITPPPHSSAGSPATTPAPAGSQPSTATPTQSLPPQTWRADPAHPATRFIANWSNVGVSYELAADVALVAAADNAAVTYDLKVSGADYELALEVTMRSGRRSLEMIAEGGTFVGRIDGGRWVTGSGSPAPANVFGPVTAEAFDRLEYVGEERYRKRDLHRLRLPTARWPGPLDRGIALVSAPALFTWDVWVDNQGRPRFAALSVAVTVRLDGVDVPLTMTVDYRFSRFGERVTIGSY